MQTHILNALSTAVHSVWRSGYKTGKRLRPNRTLTDQDRKISGLIKTVTVVQSSVHCHFGKLKTEQRLVLVVSTSLYTLKSMEHKVSLLVFQIYLISNQCTLTTFLTIEILMDWSITHGICQITNQQQQMSLIVILHHHPAPPIHPSYFPTPEDLKNHS